MARVKPSSAILIVSASFGLAVMTGCTGQPDSAPQSEIIASPRPEPTIAERYLAAFEKNDYEAAVRVADEALQRNPRDGTFLAYKGAACSMLGLHEDAVDAFRRGAVYAPKGFVDKTALYLRALSLFHARAYSRSQQVLDALSGLFPHSRVAERGQELAIRIEQSLAQGVSDSNLNWYVGAGVGAQGRSMPGLAIEMLEEYLLLSRRAGLADASRDAKARLALGASFMELGSFKSALVHLEAVPIEHTDYRAGLFLALALRATGEDARAVEVVKKVAEGAESEAIRARARAHLAAWTAQEGAR